jgi:hypothetical protein
LVLFDHVRVAIGLHESAAHGDELKCVAMTSYKRRGFSLGHSVKHGLFSKKVVAFEAHCSALSSALAEYLSPFVLSTCSTLRLFAFFSMFLAHNEHAIRRIHRLALVSISPRGTKAKPVRAASREATTLKSMANDIAAAEEKRRQDIVCHPHPSLCLMCYCSANV